jgi:deoxyhypusine synthase
MIGDRSGGHSFAGRAAMHPESLQGSELSGCIFEEAVSWGEVKREVSRAPPHETSIGKSLV